MLRATRHLRTAARAILWPLDHNGHPISHIIQPYLQESQKNFTSPIWAPETIIQSCAAGVKPKAVPVVVGEGVGAEKWYNRDQTEWPELLGPVRAAEGGPLPPEVQEILRDVMRRKGYPPRSTWGSFSLFAKRNSPVRAGQLETVVSWPDGTDRTLFNSQQTEYPPCAQEMMMSYVQERPFRRTVQRSLQRHMRERGFLSHYWMLGHELLSASATIKPGEAPFLLTMPKGKSSLAFWNIEQVPSLAPDALTKLRQRARNNVPMLSAVTGKPYAEAAQQRIRHLWRTNPRYRAPYWLSSEDMTNFDPPLKLAPGQAKRYLLVKDNAGQSFQLYNANQTMTPHVVLKHAFEVVNAQTIEARRKNLEMMMEECRAQQQQITQRQGEWACFSCGERGHFMSKCPKKKETKT